MRKLKDANGRPMGRDRIAFNAISYVLLALLSLICLLPFLLVISGSFSDHPALRLPADPQEFFPGCLQDAFPHPG